MPVRIVKLTRFPMKGACGEDRSTLVIDRNYGVKGDRVCAIRKVGTSDEWQKKAAYRVGMNTPWMVSLTPEFSRVSDTWIGPPTQNYLARRRTTL